LSKISNEGVNCLQQNYDGVNYL